MSTLFVVRLDISELLPGQLIGKLETRRELLSLIEDGGADCVGEFVAWILYM